MDMMARGKVVVSTAVDGITDYITQENNGLLIQETDEDEIVQRGIALLNRLITNPCLKKEIELQKLPVCNYAFQRKNFL